MRDKQKYIKIKKAKMIIKFSGGNLRINVMNNVQTSKVAIITVNRNFGTSQ